MSAVKAFERAFKEMEEKKWDKIFVFCDIHYTILHPDYEQKYINIFYPFAKDVLQYLSKRSDISLNLYTCSYPEEVERYQSFFRENDIHFKHVNVNPEVKNSKYGFFDTKPYFNILLEDRAGFNSLIEWEELMEYFKLKKK